MNIVKQLALKRINILFSLAFEQMHKRPKLAQRYSQIARRIAMRTRLHLPKEYRQLLCKRCKSFIIPGLNCRVRIQPRRESHVTITCISCGHVRRVPFKKRK